MDSEKKDDGNVDDLGQGPRIRRSSGKIHRSTERRSGGNSNSQVIVVVESPGGTSKVLDHNSNDSKHSEDEYNIEFETNDKNDVPELKVEVRKNLGNSAKGDFRGKCSSYETPTHSDEDDNAPSEQQSVEASPSLENTKKEIPSRKTPENRISIYRIALATTACIVIFGLMLKALQWSGIRINFGNIVDKWLVSRHTSAVNSNEHILGFPGKYMNK